MTTGGFTQGEVVTTLGEQGFAVPTELVRGPYLIADGVAAYERHRRLHQQPGVPTQPGTMADAG